MKRIARRPTHAEYRLRIALTREMVAQGCRKSEIKRELRGRFGDLSPRTIERYLRRVEEAPAEQAGGG